jgi:hypothetical protein
MAGGDGSGRSAGVSLSFGESNFGESILEACDELSPAGLPASGAPESILGESLAG